MNVSKLENIFIGVGEVKGFIFTKVYEDSKHYIFKVIGHGFTHFEVFQRRNTPICINFEKRQYSEVDFKEHYPKAKDFGYWAWWTKTYEKALEKIKIKKYETNL